MIDFQNINHVYLICEPVDMRKGLNGLASAARARTGKDPVTGDAVFAFINKSHNKIRLLYRTDNSLAVISLCPVSKKSHYFWRDDMNMEYLEIPLSLLARILKTP